MKSSLNITESLGYLTNYMYCPEKQQLAHFIFLLNKKKNGNIWTFSIYLQLSSILDWTHKDLHLKNGCFQPSSQALRAGIKNEGTENCTVWDAANLEITYIYPLKNWCKVFCHNSWILPLPSSRSFSLSPRCRFLHICSVLHPRRRDALSLPSFEVHPCQRSSATYFSLHRRRLRGEPGGHQWKGCLEGFCTAAPGRYCSHRSAALCPAVLICIGRRKKTKKERREIKLDLSLMGIFIQRWFLKALGFVASVLENTSPFMGGMHVYQCGVREKVSPGQKTPPVLPPPVSLLNLRATGETRGAHKVLGAHTCSGHFQRSRMDPQPCLHLQ